ncbi:MAG TPA: TMEM175 family protein [Candidatus Saccharimonadales bacterium]|nr:TMEM175 family protein [Candidatus Saccharimonadales bacterium]
MKPERIVSLTDGIFAIAMTLLAFQIHVPHLPAHESSAAFLSGIGVIGTQAIIYAISFMVLAVYWVSHHIQFAFIKRLNLRLIWLNITFLLLIGFVPFSAALLGTYPHEQVAILVYGTNLMLCSLMLYLIWEYATHHSWMIEEARLPAATSRSVNRRILGVPAFYFWGIAASFIDTRLSLILFAIPPVFSLLPIRARQRATGEPVKE